LLQMHQNVNISIDININDIEMNFINGIWDGCFLKDRIEFIKKNGSDMKSQKKTEFTFEQNFTSYFDFSKNVF
jgi:hypothetical protein